MVSFIDVPSLNIKDKNQSEYNQLDLGSLEEREVIVIKNNDRTNPNNIEGAVCLFKQGSSEQLNVVSWISNDLQKYATGFQYGLTPTSGTCKNQAYTVSADRLTTSHKGNSEDPSYVNKLCSLLIQKACQEIKDKLERSNSANWNTPISGEKKTATSGSDSGSEKPWFLDLHAKDIFGMALRMMQQHILEKTREASCKINARTPTYTHKDPANCDWATGSQSPKCSPGTSGTQEPLLNEPPRTSAQEGKGLIKNRLMEHGMYDNMDQISSQFIDQLNRRQVLPSKCKLSYVLPNLSDISNKKNCELSLKSYSKQDMIQELIRYLGNN
ncbi:hypothetical protein E2320_007854 [Naja naja]|nr:hypothetical protein E2320_007854 [Naja naja]